MIETQYITLDMKPSWVLPILYCSQYDIGRPLGMVVYNSGQVVNLGDYTVTIEATRTDGVAITAAVTTDGNVGAFETTATMTNKADSYRAQLVLTASGQRVASLPFTMCVIRATMDENAESIEEDETLYQQYTATVQTLIADIHATIDTLDTDFSAETNARIAADNELRSMDEVLSDNLTQEISVRSDVDAALSAQIAALQGAVGTPLVAATVADMTDTDKIYVYTGSESGMVAGNWYYYDGTQWVSGGVYNSSAVETDKTLSVSGMAADAKVTGDSLFDAIHSEKAVYPAAGTFSIPYTAYSGETLKISIVGTSGAQIWTRETEMGSNIDSVFVGGNASTLLAISQTINFIRVYATGALTITIDSVRKRLPVVEDKTSAVYQTYHQKGRRYFDPNTLTVGFAVWNTGAINANSALRCSDYIPLVGKTKLGISRGLIQFAYYDAQKVHVGGVPVTSGTHEYTQYDIPADAVYVRLNMLATDVSNTYYTLTNESEFPFEDYATVDPVDSNFADFILLRNCVDFATKFPGAKVLVKSGTYDLVSEFATEIAASSRDNYGITLCNGVHVLFESGAIVNALYTGLDDTVYRWFSPFLYKHSVGGGFTLENLVLHSSNCRYCVHDEGSASEKVSVNKYINCRMYHDNTGAGEYASWFPVCIGGGCSKHSYIDIDGCYFYSKTAETTVIPLVAYHNSDVAGAKSNINVKNCYFADKGTFRATWYGQSTAISVATVNNCSLGAAIINQAETEQSTVQNMDVVSFLNEIRT